MRFWVTILCLPLLAVGLSACETLDDSYYRVTVGNHPDAHDRPHEGGHARPGHPAYGPPPHAPAHGYRYTYAEHGVDLVYDGGLGVYVVIGYSGVYYNDGSYFRYREEHWETSDDFGDRVHWKRATSRRVPKHLRAEHDREGDEHHKGEGHKGKGRYKDARWGKY